MNSNCRDGGKIKECTYQALQQDEMSKFKFTCIITTTATWVVSCINNLRIQDESTDKHNFLRLEVLKQNETSL